MGWITFDQGGGKYCIWSTVVDDVISYDLTQEEAIEEFVERSRKNMELDFINNIMRNSGEFFKDERATARKRVGELRRAR